MGTVIDTNIRTRTFDVDSNFEGWRLDQFLCNRIPRLSRNQAAEICKEGDIDVDPPRKVKAGTRLRRGDVVTLREHLPPEEVQYDEVEILWEDQDMLVVDKPAGMLIHETATVRLNTLQHWFDFAGFPEAEAAHRIDRETSGCVVCAKKSQIVSTLRELFASEHPDKRYRALVLDPDRRWTEGTTATLDTPLGLVDEGEGVRVRMTRGELSATTHVTVRGERFTAFGRLADLEVTIETGRQHQIRVHLAMEGTPIAGDKLYTWGDDFFIAISDDPEDPDLQARLPFPRHALHAWRIALPHPVTGRRLSVTAPLPSFWES